MGHTPKSVRGWPEYIVDYKLCFAVIKSIVLQQQNTGTLEGKKCTFSFLC